MHSRFVVRRARVADGRHIGDLARDLAGPMSDREARRRFVRLVLLRNYLVFVVEDQEAAGRIVGMWFGHEGYFLGADLPYVQTMGLVVLQEYRQQGIASHLMRTCPPDSYHCQNWFTTQHPHLHDFYEGLGFTISGTRFVQHNDDRVGLPLRRKIVRSVARKVGL